MDDVLLNKAEIIERCLARVEETYIGHEDELTDNFMRQDAVILNLQRACEASIGGAMHIVRVQKLGSPQNSKDAFVLLAKNDLLDDDLSEKLQAMVGFRNVAVHTYQVLNIEILKSILDHHLKDFRQFASILIKNSH